MGDRDSWQSADETETPPRPLKGYYSSFASRAPTLRTLRSESPRARGAWQMPSAQQQLQAERQSLLPEPTITVTLKVRS